MVGVGADGGLLPPPPTTLPLPPNRSNPLRSIEIFFLRSGLGPDSPIFSICWCWDLTANRFTCTGIGTTIFVPGFPFLPRPCEDNPALTRFHLARRFWNHIFTCKWDIMLVISLVFKTLQIGYLTCNWSMSYSNSRDYPHLASMEYLITPKTLANLELDLDPFLQFLEP